MSTHLLARSQSTKDDKRWAADRRERYNFARYETVATLCAEFVGELRGLEIAARVRQSVTGRYLHSFRTNLPIKIRKLADSTEDAGHAQDLRKLADELETNPDSAGDLAQTSEGERKGELPPAVDALSTIRRLAELSARIQIQGSNDLAQAAERAQAVATSTALRLTASEIRGLDKPVDLEPLATAISHFVGAAVYETQLLPLGEKVSFEELIRQAQEETGAATDSRDSD